MKARTAAKSKLATAAILVAAVTATVAQMRKHAEVCRQMDDVLWASKKEPKGSFYG